MGDADTPYHAAVLVGMRNHARHAPVAEACCRVLSAWCAQPEHCLMLRGIGGVETVLAALMLHVAVASVVAAGLDVLRRLCAEEHAIVSVSIRDGVDVVVAGMTKHISVLEVAAAGCGMLSNMAADAGVRAQLGKEGADVLVAAVKTHPQDARVALHGSTALRRLSSFAPLTQQLVASGTLVAMVNLVQYHIQAPTVLEHVSACLKNIFLRWPPSVLAAHLEPLCAMGLVSHIIEGMRAHPLMADVQVRFRVTIDRSNHDDDDDDDDDDLMTDDPALRVFTCLSMRAQVHGAHVLAFVASASEEHAASVRAAGGVPILAAVLVWHPFDKNGVRNARAALRSLVGDLGRREAVAEMRRTHGMIAGTYDAPVGDGDTGSVQADEFTHSSSDSDLEVQDLSAGISEVDPDREEDRSRWGREEVGVNDAEMCGYNH
jgi:hypothetical protein